MLAHLFQKLTYKIFNNKFPVLINKNWEFIKTEYKNLQLNNQEQGYYITNTAKNQHILDIILQIHR